MTAQWRTFQHFLKTTLSIFCLSKTHRYIYFTALAEIPQVHNLSQFSKWSSNYLSLMELYDCIDDLLYDCVCIDDRLCDCMCIDDELCECVY